MVIAVEGHELDARLVALEHSHRGQHQPTGADANSAQLVEQLLAIANARDELAGLAQRRIQLGEACQSVFFHVAFMHPRARDTNAQQGGDQRPDRQRDDQQAAGPARQLPQGG